MSFKFFLTVLLVIAGFSFIGSQKICPAYANNNPLVPCDVVNGTCYCVASQKPTDGLFMLWGEADAFCRSANMNLVSLETIEKDREVINTINNLWRPYEGYHAYWTSGRYNYNTARFEWTATGEPLTFIPINCCSGPSYPCNCDNTLDPNNGECVINHIHQGGGYFRWSTANHTEAIFPFTCEDRNY